MANSEEHKSDGVSVVALKCPMCGANIDGYERKCTYCGSSLVIVSWEKTQPQKTDSQTVAAALAKWREVLQRDPNNAEANYALGVVYLHQGLRDPALPCLQKATQLAPEVAIYHYNYALAIFGDGDKRSVPVKVWNELVKEIDTANRLDPNFAEAKAFQRYFAGKKLDPVDPLAAAKEYEAP